MLPLFLTAGVSIDKLLRAQIAMFLFSAAYLAEVVRGGLQANKKKRHKRSDMAIGNEHGTSRCPKLYVLRSRLWSIPFFKDTSLVVILGSSIF